jgi:hypothetical protein
MGLRIFSCLGLLIILIHTLGPTLQHASYDINHYIPRANNIMFENDNPKTLLKCTFKKRSCKTSYMDNIQMVENQKNQFSVYKNEFKRIKL